MTPPHWDDVKRTRAPSSRGGILGMLLIIGAMAVFGLVVVVFVIAIRWDSPAVPEPDAATSARFDDMAKADLDPVLLPGEILRTAHQYADCPWDSGEPLGPPSIDFLFEVDPVADVEVVATDALVAATASVGFPPPEVLGDGRLTAVSEGRRWVVVIERWDGPERRERATADGYQGTFDEAYDLVRYRVTLELDQPYDCGTPPETGY